ncbi:Fic/DOC family protein [Pseudarthrobacter sp. P1]|uniref:Fic/DOC family protein n=1 Tax=Pseudarthrobacter sp. P1 TaxID=3418418 RepID=UPI003CFBA569
MDSPNFIDPYLIPGTAVLRNLVGAKTPEELAAAEADLSFARATQLLDDPVPATNDLAELKAIHFHLFQDLFEWAGQTRRVDVRKDVPGAEFFLPWGFTETASINCFEELASENHLKGLARAEFVERLAYHYEKINYIHPFREGTGEHSGSFGIGLPLKLDGSLIGGQSTEKTITVRHGPARTTGIWLYLSRCSTRS